MYDPLIYFRFTIKAQPTTKHEGLAVYYTLTMTRSKKGTKPAGGRRGSLYIFIYKIIRSHRVREYFVSRRLRRNVLFLVLEFVANLSVDDCSGQCHYYGSDARVRVDFCMGVGSRPLFPKRTGDCRGSAMFPNLDIQEGISRRSSKLQSSIRGTSSGRYLH